MKLPKLIVLIGIPGCGKSRWISDNKYHESHYIVCPDDIRHNMFGDMTDQSNNTKVFDIAKGMVIAALELEKDTIFDATNVSTYYRREFLSNISFSHKKEAVLFDIDPKIASDRIRVDMRENKLRSNVLPGVVYRMYGEYLYTKEVIGEEDFSSVKIIDATKPLKTKE